VHRASNISFEPYVKLVKHFGGFAGWNILRVDCVTTFQ
jgi:hypothetical protein